MFSCPGNWVSRFRKVIDSSCWICGGLLEQFSYSGKFVFWSSSSRNQAWTAAPLKSQLSFQLSILTLWCTYLHSLSWLVYLLLKKAMGLWPCMVFCFVLFLKLFFFIAAYWVYPSHYALCYDGLYLLNQNKFFPFTKMEDVVYCVGVLPLLLSQLNCVSWLCCCFCCLL